MGLFSAFIDNIVKEKKNNNLTTNSESVSSSVSITYEDTDTLAQQIVNNAYNNSGTKISPEDLSQYGYDANTISSVQKVVNAREKQGKMKSSIKTILKNNPPSSSVESSSEKVVENKVSTSSTSVGFNMSNAFADLRAYQDGTYSAETAKYTGNTDLTFNNAETKSEQTVSSAINKKDEAVNDVIKEYTGATDLTFNNAETKSEQTVSSAINKKDEAVNDIKEYTGATDLTFNNAETKSEQTVSSAINKKDEAVNDVIKEYTGATDLTFTGTQSEITIEVSEPVITTVSTPVIETKIETTPIIEESVSADSQNSIINELSSDESNNQELIEANSTLNNKKDETIKSTTSSTSVGFNMSNAFADLRAYQDGTYSQETAKYTGNTDLKFNSEKVDNTSYETQKQESTENIDIDITVNDISESQQQEVKNNNDLTISAEDTKNKDIKSTSSTSVGFNMSNAFADLRAYQDGTYSAETAKYTGNTDLKNESEKNEQSNSSSESVDSSNSNIKEESDNVSQKEDSSNEESSISNEFISKAIEKASNSSTLNLIQSSEENKEASLSSESVDSSSNIKEESDNAIETTKSEDSNSGNLEEVTEKVTEAVAEEESEMNLADDSNSDDIKSNAEKIEVTEYEKKTEETENGTITETLVATEKSEADVSSNDLEKAFDEEILDEVKEESEVIAFDNLEEAVDEVKEESETDKEETSEDSSISKSVENTEENAKKDSDITEAEETSNSALKFSYEQLSQAERSIPSVGKIYVIPPFDEVETGSNGNKLYSIELQNNLMFKTMSRQAAYNSLSFFGRIGDVKQYTSTGSLEQFEVTTDYYVEDSDSGWTMAKLQEIEAKLKSLVLPATTSNNSFNNTYSSELGTKAFQYFTRPPVINIVLGDSSKYNNNEATSVSVGHTVFNNLFTNINYVADSDGKKSTKVTYKNFVVTNISIDKDTEKYPYYITEVDVEKEGKTTKVNTYFDTMQFSVTLSLLEIDANYLSSMSSFDDYVSMTGWANEAITTVANSAVDSTNVVSSME